MNASSTIASPSPAADTPCAEAEPVARTVLGALLRCRRNQADLTEAEVAKALNCSLHTLRRIESGLVAPRPFTRAMVAFGVIQADEFVVLKRLWQQANAGLQVCADVEAGHTERLAALSATATTVRTFASAQLPCTLRTAAYSQALYAAWPSTGHLAFDAASGVSDGLSGLLVLDEAVLLRGCADPEAMAGQLHHLAAAVGDGLDLRIRPLGCGIAVPAGRITELDVEGRRVCVESAAHGRVYSAGEAAAELCRVLDVVAAHALPAGKTVAVLDGARRVHAGAPPVARSCPACSTRQGAR